MAHPSARIWGPAFKHELAKETRRARWHMDWGKGSTKLQITSTPVYHRDGTVGQGYLVLAVDNTRAAKDSRAGMPVVLNDKPIPFLDEAMDYATKKATGRQLFTWRGAAASLIGAPEQPKMPVRIRDEVILDSKKGS